MKNLMIGFFILLLAFASVSCSKTCTNCRFPPGAPIEYSYTDENGLTVTGQATASEGGCIEVPCNADGSSFEVVPEIAPLT